MWCRYAIIGAILLGVGVSCRDSRKIGEDFGTIVIAQNGWSVRVQNRDSDCLQVAQVGTARSSSWWCFDYPATRTLRAAAGGDDETVVYGRAGPGIESVSVTATAGSVVSKPTTAATNGMGVFLAVLPPLVGSVEVTGVNDAGHRVVSERIEVLPGVSTPARLPPGEEGVAR